MRHWLDESGKLNIDKIGRLMIALGLLLGVIAAASTITDVSNAMEITAEDTSVAPFTISGADAFANIMQPATDNEPSNLAAGTNGPAILPNGLEDTPSVVAADARQSGRLSANQPAPSQGASPQRLVIPAINLDAPVVAAPLKKIAIGRQTFTTWDVPNQFAAGWQQTSASLGKPGNTVLNGHHNEYGEVFKRLVDLKVGDQILIDSGNRQYTYLVTNKLILPEKGQPVSVRLNNARWILPTTDERLTLVTCYPYTTNTHRLIIVAKPLAAEDGVSQPDLSPLPPPNIGKTS